MGSVTQVSLLLPSFPDFVSSHGSSNAKLEGLTATAGLGHSRRRQHSMISPGKFLLHHWDSVSDLHLVNLFPNGSYNLLQFDHEASLAKRIVSAIASVILRWCNETRLFELSSAILRLTGMILQCDSRWAIHKN